MFTGIVETMGAVTALKEEESNLHISIRSDFTSELQIDQSIAHNGVCLTVVDLNNDEYTVTAIRETLDKTNAGAWKEGDRINLERCLRSDGRFDGHIVQGHVDQVGYVEEVNEVGGSWTYRFTYDPSSGNVTVPKGSICINGVSLTVVDSTATGFSVAIIPYTYEHTNFHALSVGDPVNLEFDILGKYVQRYMANLQHSAS